MKSFTSKHSQRQTNLHEHYGEDVGCFTALYRYILRKRKEYREQRLHPIVVEYKRKIIEFEEARKQRVAAEIRYQEMVVQREIAQREAKRLRFEREVISKTSYNYLLYITELVFSKLGN